MSKQDFVFTIDAHHFQVTSRLHHNKLYTPCAYVRPSVSNGKTDFDKVLIFFEKSVASEFNNWMPGYLRQSQTTGRWYTVLRAEDIDCTNTGYFDQVKSFLRKAAAKSNDMDSDFPIKHLYFRASDMCNRGLVPKLKEIRECDGAFGDAVYFKFNKEEPEEMGKKDRTVLDVWNTFTEDQKNIVSICGSMRSIPEMLDWYEILSLEGYLVYLPVFLGASGRGIRSLADETIIKIPHYIDVSDGLKTKLQQLHFRKISESDFIFVVNPGGYIGEGTMAEIEFAKKHLGNLQTPIVYLEKPEWDLSPLEGVWRAK